MSQNEVERFLGRVITDEDFRMRAQNSLHGCCLAEGFAISPEELSLLSGLDFQQFGLLAENLDGSIRRGRRGREEMPPARS
jgi:hypothetical protein